MLPFKEFEKLGCEDIEAFSDEQLSQISSKQLLATPQSVLASISAEKLEKISFTALALFEKSHIKFFSSEQLLALTKGFEILPSPSTLLLNSRA